MGIGCGPSEVMKTTEEPTGTDVPAGGSWLMM